MTLRSIEFFKILSSIVRLLIKINTHSGEQSSSAGKSNMYSFIYTYEVGGKQAINQ